MDPDAKRGVVEFQTICCNLAEGKIKSKLSQDLNTFATVQYKYTVQPEKVFLPVGELNPGLPRDRRGYYPLY